jgi:predicted small lipoprotein YifL
MPLSPMRSAPRFLIPAVLAVLLSLASGCGRSGEPFPVRAFLSAPDNLQGNHYELEAEIDAQLNWREGVGRLIAVRTLRDEARLPIFIADSLKANLLVAQRYRFEITVRKGGLLYVESLRKL